MSIKWAIIGVDDKAQEFAKGIKNSTNDELVAIATSDHYEAFCFAKKMGATRYFGDVNNIIEEISVTSVYMTKIDLANMDFIRKLLSSGKNVVYGGLFLNEKQLDGSIMPSKTKKDIDYPKEELKNNCECGTEFKKYQNCYW